MDCCRASDMLAKSAHNWKSGKPDSPTRCVIRGNKWSMHEWQEI